LWDEGFDFAGTMLSGLNASGQALDRDAGSPRQFYAMRWFIKGSFGGDGGL
jgi:hypothetical protein